MNFNQLISTRYSLREYSSKKVKKELIEKILEAGVIAPTAANKQPFKIVVVDDQNILNEIKNAYPRDWFKTVSQLFIIFGNHQTSWKRPDGKDHCDIDIAIVVDHMTLMATELGLGSCWICNFDAKMVANILKAPSHIEPMVLLPIGFPVSSEIPNKKRLPINELVSWNSL